MQIGTKLIAPNGYLDLPTDREFYFLLNCTAARRALLAIFERGKKEWDAHLVVLKQQHFERGILSGELRAATPQPSMPPHLEGLEGIDLWDVDTRRVGSKKSNIFRAQERLLAIVDYVDAWPAIVQADAPEFALNQMARERGQTPRRVRHWLLTYLCFGRSELSLYPAFGRIGHYDRASTPGSKPYGRLTRNPDLAPPRRLTQRDIDLIGKSYANLARNGQSLSKIYAEAMVKHFHATTEVLADGNRRLIAADGTPVPTLGAYRYHVNKLFGASQIRTAKYGKNRARRQRQNHGSFRETTTDHMQIVECDGFYSLEKPCSYVTGKELDRLCVVRGVCVATSQLVGIGFSLGGEHSDAYRMMLFSMAIDKRVFCSLFGIEIEEGEWVGHGLPLQIVNDRGPGSTLHHRREMLGPNRKTGYLPLCEITPTGSGQSKALIESKHPKDLRMEEPNVYVKSEKTVTELVFSEIQRCLTQNESQLQDTGYNATFARRNVRPTPAALAADLVKVGRTAAQPVPFAEAVRQFLPSDAISLTRSGAKFRSITYRSHQLAEAVSTYPDKRVRKLKAYYLPLCLRHIWVELDGRLLQLDNESIFNGGPEDSNLSEKEAIELEERRGRNRQRQDLNRSAVIAQGMKNEQDRFGRPYQAPRLTTRRSEQTPKASPAERSQHRNLYRGER